MINRVDKKAYSFYVERTNEEERNNYIPIYTEFPWNCSHKKPHLSKYFSLWWMPILTLVFLKIRGFLWKKWTYIGKEFSLTQCRQNSNLFAQY